MKRFGIGVMGCAAIARRSMIPAILSLQEQFELIAVASRNPESAENFSKLFDTQSVIGYDKLLERDDVDVVYMPLPSGLHFEWLRKAVEAGKHVLVEKSFAMNLVEAIELVAMARSKEVLLMESFMFCHHSQHSWVKERMASGDLGQIRLFRSQFGFPPLDKNNFRYDPMIGGGSLLDAGAYTVKASQMFFGTGAEVISSVLYIESKRETDICGNASLLTKDGVVCQLSFGFDNAYQCNYEFWGSTGRLVAEKAFTPKTVESPAMQLSVRGGPLVQVLMDPDDHFVGILSSFYSSLISKSFDSHHLELLDQARLLNDIKNKAIRITYEGSDSRG